MLVTDTKNKLIDFAKDSLGYFKDEKKRTVGIGGYLLDVRTSENEVYTLDVPDSYLEDGSYVNDHVIKQPLMLQIYGEVANVRYIKRASSFTDALIPSKLKSTLDNLYPNYKSNQTLQKINNFVDDVEYSKLAEVVNKTGNIYNIFNGDNKAETTKFIAFMENLYNTAMPIKVETEDRIFDNMIMISFIVTRTNQTNQMIEYQATFKQIRFAKTILNKVQKLKQNPNPAVQGKTAEKKDLGTQAGQKVETSALTTIGEETGIGKILSNGLTWLLGGSK